MLKVEGLRKSYGAVPVIRGVSFEIPEGECYALLGPSGCGKTTTLRCVAGLETANAGRIEMAGQVVYDHDAGIDVPVYDRPIGMVFQSYAIWPHLDVFENVAFPLRVGRARVSRAQIEERTMAALKLVDMEAFAKRPATALSGGQQQRVALARAVIRNPALLLLDEPLSNLDARLRDTMRKELSELIERVGVTALFVTHDQAEAFAIAQRLALMHKGVILQEGSSREIYTNPTQPFVATFLGAANVLRGKAAANGFTVGGGQRVEVPVNAPEGSEVIAIVRPERMKIAGAGAAAGGSCALSGTVTHSSYQGGSAEHTVEIAPGERLRIITGSWEEHEPGERVTVSFSPQEVRIFPVNEDTIV